MITMTHPNACTVGPVNDRATADLSEAIRYLFNVYFFMQELCSMTLIFDMANSLGWICFMRKAYVCLGTLFNA